MDLMQRRRELLAQPQQTYVKNGLVLWLDGIDKGNIPGSWVDKVGGVEFVGVNGPVFGANYVELSYLAGSYLSNATFTSPNSSGGTIEVVISDFSVSTNTIVFLSKDNGTLGFGFYNSKVIWTSGTSVQQSLVILPASPKIISINVDRAYSDAIQCEFSTSKDFWTGADPNNNLIGKRVNGNQFSGKIYCIRLYNRRLTAAEILRNQRIDNKRFNLGLNI